MKSLPSPTNPPLRGGPILRWGVLAPGVIANDFVSALTANTDQKVVAVASRSAARASSFASKHGIPKAYDSYSQLVEDPEVDVVYVAAPNSEHHPLALLTIAAGKHLLLEKPIALNATQATEIANAARRAGVFAMEAMWSRYLPQADVISKLLANGELGEPRLATVNLGWQWDYDANSRKFDPKFGGGAMLDAGVYSLWFSRFVLGAPTSVQASGMLAPTGVDTQAAVTLDHNGHAQSQLSTTTLVATPGIATINGTKARLEFQKNFVYPSSFVVTAGTDAIEWNNSGPSDRGGLAWEVTALANFVAEGRTESPLHNLDESVAIMHTVDEIRRQIGAVEV